MLLKAILQEMGVNPLFLGDKLHKATEFGSLAFGRAIFATRCLEFISINFVEILNPLEMKSSSLRPSGPSKTQENICLVKCCWFWQPDEAYLASQGRALRCEAVGLKVIAYRAQPVVLLVEILSKP